MPTNSEERKLEIIVSDDGYYAEITLILDASGTPYTITEVEDLLKERRITFGVDRIKLIHLCELKKNVYFERFAQGHMAIEGVDAEITYHFNLKPIANPKVLEDGSVDYKNMDYIELKQKGDVLASKTLYTHGSDGVDVYGKYKSVKRGRDLPLIPGKNCSLSEDGMQIIADTCGIARINNGKVEIEETIEIRSDVGVETGNIFFTGNVIVRGNLLKGYKIHAGGDLLLDGYCDGGEIKAGGNVAVLKGIQGGQCGTVACHGSLTTKYINQAICEVEGNIETGAIINSSITCNGKIIVKGKKGSIVGGQLQSSQIEAMAIGTNLGAKTYIHLGTHAISQKTLRNLNEERLELESKLKKVDQVLELLKVKLNSTRQRIAVKILFEDYLRNRENLILELQRLSEETAQIKEALEESNGILIARTIYPDTTVKIGGTAHSFSEAIMDVKVSKRFEKIHIESLN